MTEKYCKPHPINPWNAYDFPYNFYKFLLLTTPRKKYKCFSLFYYLKILWNDRDRIFKGFYSEPRFHALAIFCEILNRKISIKATHPQRLSYKLKNTLSSRITWWHLAAILDLSMMRCELQRWRHFWRNFKSKILHQSYSSTKVIVQIEKHPRQ